MTRVAYAVPPWLVGVFAVVGAVAWATAARTPFPGRFLFGVVAVTATVETARSTLLRPTLRADANGIEVLVGLRRETIPWSRVEHLTTLDPPSQGRGLRRSANALEIDLGDRLVVVPAYRLGASGATVADELTAIRAAI